MSHVHVSEVPDSPVVECTWATFLEVAIAAFEGGTKPPATSGEREALRIAGGGSDVLGADVEQGIAGCQHRYGWAPQLVTLPAIAPAPGTYLGIQGKASALPARLQHGFLGDHALTVFDRGAGLMICDPLVPWLVRDPKGGTIAWMGEPVTWAEVTAFHRALPGAGVVIAKVGEAVPSAGPNAGGESVIVVTRTPFVPPRRFTVKAGTVLNAYDPKRPGAFVATMTLQADSANLAAARVAVEWTGAAQVPTGAGFLEVVKPTAGGSAWDAFDGLLIVEARVTLDPDPVPAKPKVTIVWTGGPTAAVTEV